jgi:hypothetical protein
MTTEDQINMMLIELKKINSYLEKIDWKLWNLHEKYADPTRKAEDYTLPAFTPAVAQSVVKAQLTKETVQQNTESVKKTSMSFDMETVAEVEPAIPAIPKYPSIEDL